jgi:nitrate reductase assembly molybdenum cofactor insertion protein NarJ
MPALAPAHAEDLERRAVRAELLAILFGPASEGALALARELSAVAAEAPGAQLELLQLAALLAQLDVPTWDSHRVQLFSVGTSVDCPAFETAYFAAEAHRQSHRMADLAGLYRAFGVVPAPSSGRPDDLPVELEFLAFMLRKEAFAVIHGGAPRVAQVQKGLRILLRDHLGRWVPLLAGRLQQRAAGTFFGPAARLLQQVVDDEAARLGIDAIEPAPGFDPAAWETPRSHGPELGVSSFVSLDQLVTGEVAP